MANRTAVVTANQLNLRTEPSTESVILDRLARGTRLEVLNTAGAWYQVQVGGRTGFVHGDLIHLESDPAAGFLHEQEDLASAPLPPGSRSPALKR